MATNPSPGVFPVWDSSLTNISATTNGHKTSGYANSEVPTAGEFNYLWNLFYQWIPWVTQQFRITFPKLIGAPTGVTESGSGTFMGIVHGTTATVSYTALDVPQGFKLTSVSLKGASSTGTPSATISVIRDATPPLMAGIQAIGGKTATLSTTPSDIVVNLIPATAGLTVTVAIGSGNVTFTRSSGNFLTDGFASGMNVVWTGFVNPGNNATFNLTNVSSTVMTALQGGAVAETGAAAAETVTALAPLSDASLGPMICQISCTPGSGTVGFGDLRFACVPF